jgi:hypothetical protein
MASTTLGQAERARVGASLRHAVGEQGSAAHPYLASPALLRGPETARNLADAVHFLCLLYGRQPSAIDHAANRCVEAPERDWFKDALQGFAIERTLLTRLVVAAGPIPSTAGAVDSENAVIGQRHAIEMLAQSERRGCPLGAALGIALDWAPIRTVLDAAAARFGIEAPVYGLSDPEAAVALADAAAVTPGMERAILFGASQIAIQHRGLWDLLEARQQARAAHP